MTLTEPLVAGVGLGGRVAVDNPREAAVCPLESTLTRPVVVVVRNNVKQSESIASRYVYIYMCVSPLELAGSAPHITMLRRWSLGYSCGTRPLLYDCPVWRLNFLASKWKTVV